MKRRITNLVRESFLTNPPKRSDDYTNLSQESWLSSETLENGEYRLRRVNYYHSGVSEVENLEAYSLFVRERFLGIFWKWKSLDVASKYLQPLFVDFYVRRK